MVAKQYYDILLKITDVMEEKGGGIFLTFEVEVEG
jgi:hypothetical protein